MTTQVVQGKLFFTDGTVGLLNGSDGDGGASTDGQLTEIQSDVDFYVVASSAGNQWNGRTIKSALVQGATFVSYAYVLNRDGNVGAMLPVSSRASGAPYAPQALATPAVLNSGDTIQVMTAA